METSTGKQVASLDKGAILIGSLIFFLEVFPGADNLTVSACLALTYVRTGFLLLILFISVLKMKCLTVMYVLSDLRGRGVSGPS